MTTRNANWTAKVGRADQVPVYFLDIDGHSTDYATAPVKGASPAKTVLMGLPSGGGSVVDVIAGTHTVGEVTVPLFDVDGQITALLSTEASGAPLATMINRKATLYAGFRGLDVTDYEPVFTGRIGTPQLSADLTTYLIPLLSLATMLAGKIMRNATETKPSKIRGNVVNVYWSLLTGTFDTGHATFPLDFVSTDTASSSVPTGLGIPTSLIDETLLLAERDFWHAEDVVEVELEDPEEARSHLELELFRIWQCFPTISGDGKLGLKFHVPAMPPSDARVIDEDTIIDVVSWRRLYSDHLNKFTLHGDWNKLQRDYDTVLYPVSGEPAEDTTNQGATGQVIEYLGQSKWIKSAYNGEEIAYELMGRLRLRYLYTPALVEVDVNITQQGLEQGEVVAVTHPDLPDLFAGTRGLSAKLMTIISRSVQFATGRMRLALLDTGYRRYGVIAPAGKTASYASATDQERNTFCYIADSSGEMSDGTPGYRLI